MSRLKRQILNGEIIVTFGQNKCFFPFFFANNVLRLKVSKAGSAHRTVKVPVEMTRPTALWPSGR